ncbi:MAG: AmmeMemoRadiSam system protein B [Nitrososphaerota archaeon]|nr:AmmeMemoRadiSam system protein B [Nitrososphaerota archaeon]MDG6946328.1 AmmeMemoRadiSam system protein B [Nitrososphaerota archaeon]MDG6948060.1 AmmeMemoRadiSam system protein B [Nitrososphaerota archaeon]
MPVRKPAVSGQFYPSAPSELSALIDECYTHRLGPGRLPPAPASEADIVAVVSPHAGYVYSGPVAAHSYYHVSSLRTPDLAVVVGPNHYGIGGGVSTYEGEWVTPLGRMRVDEGAAAELVELAGVSVDPEAHRLEHSIEVQLPFLQKLYGGSVPFLPVSLLFQDQGTAEAVASALARMLRGRSAVLVASSDLTHYEPPAAAKEKDMALLGEVLKMDVSGFYSVLERLGVTACGYGAIAIVMLAARSLGLTRGELLAYATSGDTSGDNVQVVGYGALRFVSS